jgi:two-component system KDP operon response regulator KdpE
VTGARLLLVEDDAVTRSAVAANLAAHGYTVIEAADGAGALRAWDSARPDVVILDLGLPDTDGISVVRRLRREAATPILILSARGREEDKIGALEAGADDYVTKPFGIGEVRARIAALLRRSGRATGEPDGVLRSGSIALDPQRRSVTVNAAVVELTPREFELLKQLLMAPGRVLTRGRLLRAVWGTAYSAEGHYLHVYVSRLRRKLAAADPSGDARDLVAAEPGVGYRVREDPATA